MTKSKNGFIELEKIIELKEIYKNIDRSLLPSAFH